MRARQTQNVQQVVKINLQAPRRRKRVAKKTVRELKSGAPDTFRSENVAPIPFFGRQGPQVEPLRVQRVEEPRQLRLEDFGEGFVPPRPFRQYLTSLIEQPRTSMRIEEVKEDRMEAPPPPLIPVGPLAGMGSSRVVFEEEDLSPNELFALRDRGKITKEFLASFPMVKKDGMSLFRIASRLGLVVPGPIQRGTKAKFIDFIVENV